MNYAANIILALIHSPCYILLKNSTYGICGAAFYLQKQMIEYVIKSQGYTKIYYTHWWEESILQSNQVDSQFHQLIGLCSNQYDLIVINLLSKPDRQRFDYSERLLALIQQLHGIRFHSPWQEIITTLKGIIVIASCTDKIIQPLIQYIPLDCIIDFTEMSDLQLTNSQDLNIINYVNLDQKSLLNSFIMNYISDCGYQDNRDENQILCDIFTEIHLFVCQYALSNQNSSFNHLYSVNYLSQALNVWLYLHYYKQNSNVKQNLLNQLNETNLLFDSMKTGYQTLESQITEAYTVIELLKKDLTNYLDIYLPEARLNQSDTMERLKYLENEIECKEGELEHLKKPMSRMRKLAQIEFNKLKDLYRIAVQGLHGLSIEDLDEIRSYREPPDAVKDCVYIICMLMDEEENWENAKHMMVPVKFISKILKLHTQLLDKTKYRELRRRLIDSVILTPENLLQISVAASRLCQWLRALCECCNANELLQSHINNYSSADSRVNQIETMLGNLHLSLQLTKLDLEMINTHLTECENQTEHLSRSIETLEYKISEAKSLSLSIQCNLDELMNSSNPSVVSWKSTEFWLNILGGLGIVYVQMFPVKHRSSLWSQVKQIVWNKMKDYSCKTMITLNENSLIDKTFLQNLQLFTIIQSQPYEVMRWLSSRKFPFEVGLLYHDKQIGYILEAVLAIRTILLSGRCCSIKHQNRIKAYDWNRYG
ncbi:unnamed protein product [Heterobilharzia americana]|nr:unnamed protein product [Heterobilharzia americana]